MCISAAIVRSRSRRCSTRTSSDVPDGMSPVVFVFDDASPEQFSYIEGADGKLTIDPNERRRHLARFRQDASGLEEPRDVLPAQRRVGGPQLFRRQPEVPRPEESVALPEGEMARRPGLRAVRPHGLARDAEQVQRRRGAGADRAQRHGDRLGGAELQGADDGAAVRHLAEEPPARVAGIVDGPQDRSRRTRTSSTRCSRWRAVRRGARSIRSSIAHSINRIEAIGNDIAKTLDGLDKSKTRFVK